MSPHPADSSPHFQLSVNGRALFVHDSVAGSFASFECPTDGRAEIVIHRAATPTNLVVRPQSRNIEVLVDGQDIRFSLTEPGQLYLDFAQGPPLFLFANPPEEQPDFNDPNVIAYRAAGVHEAGIITLTSGQTLFIAAGAVVWGCVHAVEAENIRIRGHGVLDGSHFKTGSQRMIRLESCRNVTVEGITTVGTPNWNLVIGGCQDVRVDNVKLIGWVVGSDGIDIVGSRDVHIQNSFVRANDDCIAVKAIAPRPDGSFRLGWDKPVSNVLVERCVFYNDAAGNALEIGFETQTASMRDITFRDCDIIGAHGEGGVFTIHNGDRALIENILWEDIRVEHFYSLLVDFRVLDSRWSRDDVRGQIRNVTLKRIRVVQDIFNTPSLAGGYDADHTVSGIHFEDFQIGGVPITSCDQLNLYARHAADIRFGT